MAHTRSNHAERHSARWRMLRGFLTSVGMASNGIRLGFTHGFDSGLMLDYVYRNRASGAFPIGPIIDRIFLDSKGWQGCRSRKELVQEVIVTMVTERHKAGLATNIVDIAAGAGRYLIEAYQVLRQANAAESLTVVCRDLDKESLALGRKRADAAGLTGIRFERGDALDAPSLAALRPVPDIVVASGLYEILPPELTKRSMAAVYGALPPGGRLVFTTLVRHPQLEMIAAVLVTREGKPWVMECRSIAETGRWAMDVGFQVLDAWLEPHSMYAVTVCEKAPVVPTVRSARRARKTAEALH